jgi:hypothetical protein
VADGGGRGPALRDLLTIVVEGELFDPDSAMAGYTNRQIKGQRFSGTPDQTVLRQVET